LKPYILCFSLLFIFQCIFESKGQCADKNIAFQGGESIRFEVYYNWGFIWLNVGEAEFKVDSVEYLGQTAFHINSYGTSYKFYDWFYKVRDYYDAIVNPVNIHPYKFTRSVYEGKFVAENIYYFDYQRGKIYYSVTTSDLPLTEDTIALQSCTFDILSLVYYARNIDYSKYEIDEKIPVAIVLDGQLYNLYIRYLGKEVLKTKDKRKYNCIKFSPLLIQGGMFEAGENMTVWVSDDQNKIPILIESKIVVGTVKAILSDIQGLRNDITALID